MATETTLQTAPAKRQALLLEVEIGRGPDGWVERYANFDDDILIGSEPFIALPRLEVALPKMDGGAEDQSFTITMTREGFATLYGRGEATPPVVINIDECDPSDPATTRRALYRGEVINAALNPRGLSGLIELTLAGTRAKMKIPLGTVATSTCAWAFGDKQCCVDLSDKTFVGEVSAISGLDVTIVFGSGGPDSTAAKWRNGVLSYAGNRIKIRKGDGSTFTLSRFPPAAWLGKNITAIYGCDKSLAVCVGTWDNELRWGGIGLQMPDHSTLAEDTP